MNDALSWFNKGPHHKSLLIFGSVAVAFLLWQKFRGKNATNSMDVLWAAVAGAVGVEAVKAFTRIQGGSTG